MHMQSNQWSHARGLVLGLALFLSAPVFAADYSCSGPVNGVSITPGGIVAAASAGGQSWGFFCQLGQTTNGVTPEACKAILTILLTAQTTDKRVTIWFRDDLSCSANRGWNWLSTVYWGPMIEN
jgi:disulfide bond formation protein DsbB